MNIFHWVIYAYFAYLFVLSCFVKYKMFNLLIAILGIFLLFKWLSDFRLCTVSYIEVKLRNVPIKDGYMYRFMDELVDFNKFSLKYILYIIVLFIILRNMYILKYK